jgi:GDP-L-fucose synthase
MLFVNLYGKKIVVTGGSGFLGSRVVEILKKRGVKNIIIPRSENMDLRKQNNCEEITKNVDIIFHLAAKVGGIGLNQKNPGQLFYDNLIMGTHLMEEARKNNIEKFVALGTICSYPKFTPIPFKEESIWDGYPEETNAPYGLAKKMLMVQSQAYKQEYDFSSIVIFPTNLYGPKDNFDDEKSHVIPAIIKKMHYARINNSDTVSLWGDGTPTRDFLYVDDAAEGIVLSCEKYEDTDPLNLGSGNEVSIKELAETINRLMKTNLKINWETDKPNGQPRRCIDSTKASTKIGFKQKTDLETGLLNTIKWFEEEYIT